MTVRGALIIVCVIILIYGSLAILQQPKASSKA